MAEKPVVRTTRSKQPVDGVIHNWPTRACQAWQRNNSALSLIRVSLLMLPIGLGCFLLQSQQAHHHVSFPPNPTANEFVPLCFEVELELRSPRIGDRHFSWS
jgi:hypothetical protein